LGLRSTFEPNRRISERSYFWRRCPSLPDKAYDNPPGCFSSLADLGGVANDGDNRYTAATDGTGQDVDFIYLCTQAGPCAAPLPSVNLAILGQVRKVVILTGDTAIPAFVGAALL
jgi:hypothetical protein